MRISDAYRDGRPTFSFEFFPPKNEEGRRNLRETVRRLKELRPDFVSVTYGAGGSTRELTIELVTEIKNELGVEAMAHLTCVGHTARELADILDRLAAAGIENVIALRGDPPRGQKDFVRPAGGFGYGSELASFIHSRWDFSLAGACYPEGHIESADPEQDVRYAKLKQDAGVDVLISQLFFEPQDHFQFVRKARAAGVTVPIVPGILPVTSAAQLSATGFVQRCGARIPEALREQIEAVADDDAKVIQAGIDWTTAQCRILLEGGAPGIHFYTLNRSHSTWVVFENLKAALPATVGAR